MNRFLRLAAAMLALMLLASLCAFAEDAEVTDAGEVELACAETETEYCSDGEDLEAPPEEAADAMLEAGPGGGEDAPAQTPEEAHPAQPEPAIEPTPVPSPEIVVPAFTGNACRVPVLAYHMVLTDELKQRPRYVKDRFAVSVTAFEKQMAWLRTQGYTAITCEQLYLWHQGAIRLPGKSVLITLDDGYASTIENIIPILEKYDLKATEFIIGSASYAGNPGFVTYDRIQQIRSDHPCMAFQSHTWNLHRKNTCKTENYAGFAADAAMQHEVYGFEYVAYPYGKNNKAMRSAYRKNGVKMAFLFGSSHNGYATRKQNLMKIRRIEITGDMGMRRFKRWCK